MTGRAGLAYVHVIVCESCGDDRPDLIEVRRMYVTPPAWDTEGKVEPAADTEKWCVSCTAHYPHQAVTP